MSAERRREVLELRREVVGDLQELADLVERLLRLPPEEDLSPGSAEDPDKVVFVRHAGRQRRELDTPCGEHSRH